MALKTGIVFCALLLSSLAVPVPEQVDDLSIFFETASPDARIVGGSVAEPGAHPWMVAMTSGTLIRSFSCGASVISQRTVLTAAHCIAGVVIGNFIPSSLRLHVGSNRWNQPGQALRVNGFANHEQYNSRVIKNDIGLWFTASDIIFNENVAPISLNFEHISGGVLARAAGWGRISSNGAIPQQLLELVTPTISGEECIRGVQASSVELNMVAPPVEPSIELCTFHSRGSGTCRGDSGSALVRIQDNSQIGIVSWGFPCALGAPDMFVRVSAYESWIAQRIRD